MTQECEGRNKEIMNLQQSLKESQETIKQHVIYSFKYRVLQL